MFFFIFAPPLVGHSFPRVSEGRSVQTRLAVQRKHEQCNQRYYAGGYGQPKFGGGGDF